MFVFPMAGRSSRFYDAGYQVPKYQLLLFERPLFDWVLLGFSRYFETDVFIFIVSDTDASDFVEARCKYLKIKNIHIEKIEVSRGQAETVYKGISKYEINNEELYIFNIDTIRPNFKKPHFHSKIDGYLEVFKGSGKNWSNVLPLDNKSSKVILTAEKMGISNLCCTGLYYFKNFELFKIAYYVALKRYEIGLINELYIAPIYNDLIMSKSVIEFREIEKEDVTFCGVPEEYEEIQRKFSSEEEWQKNMT